LKDAKNSQKDVILLIAGGYDSRLIENVQHHLELRELAIKLKI
jgi:hypothetical protein